MSFLSRLFGRSDPPRPPRSDAENALYVHLTLDGRILLLPGDTGRRALAGRPQLIAEIKRLPDGKGTILYTREAPDIALPAKVEETFQMIVLLAKEKRLSIRLVEPHPMAAEQAEVLLNFAASGRTDLAAERIRAGADVNQQDPTGLSPLMSAAFGGHVAVLDLLLAKGASLELTDKEGFTPLCFACNAGQAAAVTRLLAAGANVNHRDKADSTPAMLAAQHGHTAIVEALIAKGADVQARGKNGLTALGFAMQNGSDDTVRILRGHGAKE